jgi:aryl-alcohol dehydrogenase-like predicted oxidoreductase
MERRALGRTGIEVSVLGFGCGDVGGLIVRGAPAERTRAVARAVELGVNYFDTATSYGAGVSEQHLGEVLRELRPDVHVGTKVRLTADDLSDIRGAVTRSLEASLRRLGLPRVDLLQLHNMIVPAPSGTAVGVRQVLDEVVPALQQLQQQGKIRFFGITGNGDPDSLHQVIDSGTIHTTQVFYNLLNPSAGGRPLAGLAGVDFKNLLSLAKRKGVGTIGVRVLAAGALSGAREKHPIAMPSVSPIASGASYDADVRGAEVLAKLVKDGFAGSMVEAAYRFVITHDGISTALVGASTLDHLEQAASAVNKGPLPSPAITRLTELWQELRA